MKNLGQMMKKAQEMQTRMGEIQDRMEHIEVEGASGGGLVHVTLSGKGVMRKISIDPTLLNEDDREVVEDLIVAAHNDAKTKVEEKTQGEMSELTGGLDLPAGFKLPF